MDYAQAIAWLYESQRHGIKLALDHVRNFLAALEIANLGQRFIHVAGTNGKGSVCAMIESICRHTGMSTGLFTSPHLVDFCERIRINGNKISEQDVAAGLTRIREAVGDLDRHPTFFEMTTALALDYFQRQHPDVIILETGMGGRLDATNVVTPLVSVITAIGYDHQAWLGNSLEEIAAEKAGIIKPSVPVVSLTQEPAAAEVIIRAAAERGAPLQLVNKPVAADIQVALAGTHQRLNAALAVAAVQAAGLKVRDEAIRAGLAHVSWPGRFQIFGDDIILDGAHNPAAIERTIQTWRESYSDVAPTVILGVLRDKNVEELCAQLLTLATLIITTPVRSSRSCSSAELAQILAAKGAAFAEAENFSHAFALARKRTAKILITGSLFLVGEALALLSGKAAPSVSDQ